MVYILNGAKFNEGIPLWNYSWISKTKPGDENLRMVFSGDIFRKIVFLNTLIEIVLLNFALKYSTAYNSTNILNFTTMRFISPHFLVSLLLFQVLTLTRMFALIQPFTPNLFWIQFENILFVWEHLINWNHNNIFYNLVEFFIQHIFERYIHANFMCFIFCVAILRSVVTFVRVTRFLNEVVFPA